MSGIWNVTGQNEMPGLYVRFLNAGKQAVVKEKGGVVALTLETYSGSALAKSVTKVTDTSDLDALFGAGNHQAVDFALENAEEVLVYAVEPIDGTTVTIKTAYDNARFALDVYNFDVFVYGEIVTAAEQDDALKWVKQAKSEGRHYFVVFGTNDANEDANISLGNARSARLAHEYAINVVSGAKRGAVSYDSASVASYIAGLVASTPLTESLTFKEVEFDDTTERLTFTQRKAALEAGSFVLTNGGEYVRIERGITTKAADAEGNPIVTKIRKSAIEKDISVELIALIEKQIIGKIMANDDGYAFAVTMVKVFLEQLEIEGIISDITVKMSSEFVSSGDELYIDVTYTEVESVEKVFLTITI